MKPYLKWFMVLTGLLLGFLSLLNHAPGRESFELPVLEEGLSFSLEAIIFEDKGKDPKKEKDSTKQGKDDKKGPDKKGKDDKKEPDKKGKDDKKEPDKKGKDTDKKGKDDKKEPDKKGKDDKKEPDKKGKDDKKDYGSLKHLGVKVGGQEREALVAYPKSPGKGGKDKKAAPVVFVFHGHGENMKVAADAFGCHKHWDEAICVYMQGLKTPRPSDPAGLGLGWQSSGDRDYLFFDTVLAQLKKGHAIDDKRIFATGFSNGAIFTYDLWAKRGPKLRAVAACAGVHKGTSLIPKPCLHIAGTKDTTVDFKNQKDTIELIRKINGCEGKGTEWPKKKGPLHGTLFSSSKGTPTAQLIHGGAHEVPAGAGTLIVEFFKEAAKK